MEMRRKFLQEFTLEKIESTTTKPTVHETEKILNYFQQQSLAAAMNSIRQRDGRI